MLEVNLRACKVVSNEKLCDRGIRYKRLRELEAYSKRRFLSSELGGLCHELVSSLRRH